MPGLEPEDKLDFMLGLVDEDPGVFSEWEQDFLERLRDVVQNWHLTQQQEWKVRQIFSQRVKRGKRADA